MNLELYYTEGCHLCEHAEEIINHARLQGFVDTDVNVLKVDIASDDLLVEKYGVLIPVLKAQSSNEFLNWPFSLEQFTSYLNRVCPA